MHNILTNTPDIKNEQKISVQEYDIEIQPFMNWDITQPAQSLQWWGEHLQMSNKAQPL